ncbi:uncharacterized protein [Clytia hemisphaerica]|uniref:uncharacterized protein isoform X2 n=1 Tax=Clytia hemisphaerica TaxID=252671 RepID=UPI0034D5C072
MSSINTNLIANDEVKVKKKRGRPPKVPLSSTNQVFDVSQSQLQVSKSPIRIAPRPGSVTTPHPLVLGILPRNHTTLAKKKKPIQSKPNTEPTQTKPNDGKKTKQTKNSPKKAKKSIKPTVQTKKDDHRAEEQRRKHRINVLIQSLGTLLFGAEGENKTKRTILEKSYEYIHQREKNPNPSCSQSKEQSLITRIKDLEASIIVLLNILKENNIQAPDGFCNNPELCRKASPAQTNTPDNQLLQDSIQSDIQHPLHIHLVIPSLSQVKTTTIITLTASAPTMDTLSTVSSKMNPIENKQHMSIISSHAEFSRNEEKLKVDKEVALSFEKDEIDFQTSGSSISTTSSQLVERISSISLPNQIQIVKVTHTEAKEHPATNSVPKSISSSKTATYSSTTLTTPKSSAQKFGIDRILVSNDQDNKVIPQEMTTNSVSKIGELSSEPTNQPEKFMKHKLLDKRTRLPSSGHTVAALLDSGVSKPKELIPQESAQNIKTPKETLNPVPNTVKEQTLKKLKKSLTQNVVASKTSNPITSTSQAITPGPRWGSFVESAQNSDKYLLSSFTLSSSAKKVINKRTLRTHKETKTYKETPKYSNITTPAPIKVINTLKATTSAIPTNSNVLTASSSSLTLNKIITTNSLPVKDNQTTTNSSKVSDTKPIIFSPVSTILQSTTSSSTSHTTNNPALILTSSQTSSITRSFKSVSSAPEVVTTSTNKVTLSYPPQMKLSLKTSQSTQPAHHSNLDNVTKLPTIQPQSNKIVRTMKDRTIKNKWLAPSTAITTTLTAKTTITMETSQPPSLKISTPDCEVEQCASPVISYPNISKRKRKLTSNSNYKQSSASNTEHLPKTPKTNSNNLGAASSKIFSAESLSRSSNKGAKKPKHDNKDIPNTNSSKKDKPFKKSQSSSSSHQRVQMPTDFSNVSNSLPTILNIFAPAPVPTTQMSQQQTFPSAAFSNFSAETLAGGNEMMDGSTFNDNNFSDNMLMAANSQLFTNFSADSLIGSGNEPQVPFAQMNQGNNAWNQPWLPQDMNEALFQNSFNGNITSMRQQNRQLMQQTTECSPIKSIMSILNSGAATNNPSNFQFDSNSTDQGNQLQQNLYQHQIQQTLQQSQQQQNRQQQQTLQQPNLLHNQQIENNLPRAAMRINFNGTETTNNEFIHPWLANKSNPYMQRNSNNSNMSGQAWSNFQTMHNQMIRMPLKDGNNPLHTNLNLNQNDKLMTKDRTTGPSGPIGPMFGNTALVNTNPQS